MSRLAKISGLLLMCLASAPGPLAAQSLRSMYEQGNSLYQQGDFAAAERVYRGLLERGVDAGAVYYNLGNACFKQARLGEAIYYWERAREKLPGDPDIESNLELARLLIGDRMDVPEDPLPIRWISALVHRLSVSQESRVVLILFVLCNALLSLYQLAARRRTALVAAAGTIALGSLLVLFSASLAWKVYEKQHRRQGIVVEQAVEMRSGPGGDYITVTTIHEGIRVRIRGDAEGWYQVSLPNGWTGWLPRTSLRIL
ncbi:MAG: tetratricopeptide repeat protein [Acidobacteriota bacterium]